MTPQELLDLPGAGSARKQLIKEGIWDTGPSEYIVTAFGTTEISMSQTVRVTSNIEDEAKKAARKSVDIDHVHDYDVIKLENKICN